MRQGPVAQGAAQAVPQQGCAAAQAGPQPGCAALQEGNTRRKTESTDANAVSSRSHAVLEVQVRRKELSGAQVGSLCVL